jgi:hypothetical protein
LWLISAALVAGNIIDGDGGRISQTQNLVDCIPLQIRRTFSWQDTFCVSRCIALSYDCFASTRAVTSPVRDRMPVILDPDGYDLWFDPGMTNVAAASELLEAFRCPADAALSREHADQ